MHIVLMPSARKHEIFDESIYFVIQNFNPIAETVDENDRRKLHWVEEDSHGVLLEISALVFEDVYYVIHAMPRRFRRGRPHVWYWKKPE